MGQNGFLGFEVLVSSFAPAVRRLLNLLRAVIIACAAAAGTFVGFHYCLLAAAEFGGVPLSALLFL